MMTITPSPMERRNWSLMAQAAYSQGRNDQGHRYSVASAVGGLMTVERFEAMQRDYKVWEATGAFPARVDVVA